MKGLTKLLAAAPLLLVTGMLTRSATLQAHEFIVKPQQLRVESVVKLPFDILATHFFMIGEEVEPVNTVKAWLVEGEKRTAIELKENQTLKTLVGVAALNRKGTAVLIGHLQEPIEALKTEGSSKSRRIKREKFAKALIAVSTDDDGYKKTLGHKLEIVPVSNVMKATQLYDRRTANRSSPRFKRPTTASADATTPTPTPPKPWKMVWHMSKSTIPESGWCAWKKESKKRPRTMTFML
jgi:hypothetical protein